MQGFSNVLRGAIAMNKMSKCLDQCYIDFPLILQKTATLFVSQQSTTHLFDRSNGRLIARNCMSVFPARFVDTSLPDLGIPNPHRLAYFFVNLLRAPEGAQAFIVVFQLEM